MITSSARWSHCHPFPSSGTGLCWVPMPRELARFYQAAYQTALRRVAEEQVMKAVQHHILAVASSN